MHPAKTSSRRETKKQVPPLRAAAPPRQIITQALLALPVVLAVAFAFLLPYARAFLSVFGAGGKVTVWENTAILRVTLFTVKQASLSVLVALAIGLPGAWIVGTSRSRLTPLFRIVTAIPFAMPSILVVLGFVLFFGNSGWVNKAIAIFGKGPVSILYRTEAIVLAHGFFNFPLVIRLAGDGLQRARKAYAPAAYALGASPLVTAFTVILPLALPAIASAALLVFLYSFTSFAVVLVLGGGPASTTLAVEIYRHARVFLNYHNAAALAVVETGIAVSVFLAFAFFGKKSREIIPGTEERILEEKRGWSPFTVLAVLYCAFAALFVLGPIVSVALESLLYRPSRSAARVLSFRWWASLGASSRGDTFLPAVLRSFLLAFCSATLSCILAITGALSLKLSEGNRAGNGATGRTLAKLFRFLVRFLAVSPIVSSGIVLGLGWLILYGGNLSRTPFALMLLHAVIALPFAFHSVSEGFRQLSANTLSAALVCGAGPVRALLTTALPLSLPRIRSAWGFAAALSLGELNAVMMLGMEGWETLPLYIYRAAGAYRYGLACAAGTLLVAGCAAGLLLSESKIPLAASSIPLADRK